MDRYDIDSIIGEALRSNIDISPADREEWKMFCCSLKVLGYDESTFAQLSSCSERESGVAWRAEKNPRRYRSEEQAKGMIVRLAKDAGMDVRKFLLSPERNDKRERTEPRAKRPTPTPTAPPVYISAQQIEKSIRHFRETSLYIWLCKEFDPDKVDEVFLKYRIGGSSFAISAEGVKATSLPYISAEGNCIDCKLQHYDTATGSRKGQPITWALARMKHNDRRGNWCNFGDHLLKIYPDAEVYLVEAEKSALILSLCYPDKLWIALGSMQNLNTERCESYRGRKIVIVPDRDGLSEWEARARTLANEGHSISIDTTVRRYPGNPKDDLADIVLRCRHGEQEPPTPTEPIKKPIDLRPEQKRAGSEPMPDHGTPDFEAWANRLVERICNKSL